MLGTWMTANVFMRIIPRQLLMVESSRRGEPVNQDWGKNAKNRSTHNTYFTLPVIFIMLSNHFPQTYGHEYNWIVLLIISAGGAAIREFFVVRLKNPKRSMISGIVGIALIAGAVVFTQPKSESPEVAVPHEVHEEKKEEVVEAPAVSEAQDISKVKVSVQGNVFFEGTPPVGKKLNLPAACAKEFSGAVFSNEVIVKDQKIQNVLVRIVTPPPGVYSDVPAEEIELDQHGCMYTPRVVAARVGQKVTFINSDSVFHNVRSVTTANQKFNMAMPKKNQRETKTFLKPELFLQAKCSVHPWMGAYVAVMDHPYFAVTGASGKFEIKNLPVGNYTLEAWHEVFGTQKQEITVTEKGLSEIKFTFK
jgi:plastocyanin